MDELFKRVFRIFRKCPGLREYLFGLQDDPHGEPTLADAVESIDSESTRNEETAESERRRQCEALYKLIVLENGCGTYNVPETIAASWLIRLLKKGLSKERLIALADALFEALPSLLVVLLDIAEPLTAPYLPQTP